MKGQITLELIQETKYSVPSRRWWKDIIQQSLSVLKEHNKISLTIIFISPIKSYNLNRSWRKKNKTGLILSFPGEQREFSSINPLKFIGDIFLCPQLIEKEARKQSISSRALYKKLVVHGLLHLYGYSHHSNKEWKKMRKMEDKILNNIK